MSLDGVRIYVTVGMLFCILDGDTPRVPQVRSTRNRRFSASPLMIMQQPNSVQAQNQNHNTSSSSTTTSTTSSPKNWPRKTTMVNDHHHQSGGGLRSRRIQSLDSGKFLQLNDKDIALIAESWRKIDDRCLWAQRLFAKLFVYRPQLAAVMGYQDVSGKRLLTNPHFLDFCQRFAAFWDDIVCGLCERGTDEDWKKVVAQIRDVGARHSRIPKITFEATIWLRMKSDIVQSITGFKDIYRDELCYSWNKLLMFVVTEMKDAFNEAVRHRCRSVDGPLLHVGMSLEEQTMKYCPGSSLSIFEDTSAIDRDRDQSRTLNKNKDKNHDTNACDSSSSLDEEKCLFVGETSSSISKNTISKMRAVPHHPLPSV